MHRVSEGGSTTAEARKLAGIGVVDGRNEVESLRPDTSLTMSTVRLLATSPDARTPLLHVSSASEQCDSRVRVPR